MSITAENLPVDKEAILAACREVGYEEIAMWAATEMRMPVSEVLNVLYDLGEE